MMPRLDIDRVRDNLRTEAFGQSLFYFEKLSSTNDKLAELARGGNPEGTAIVAETQTAGRGRQGNTWYSPPGLGLYLSVLLRPSLPALRLSGITLALGLAAARAIEQCTPAKIQIKWPNDLYCQGRKVGGLLVESHDDFLIAGIGVNANNELIPLELCDIASSLYLETGAGVCREDLLVKLLENLESHYREFLRDGLEPFRSEMEKRFYLSQRWVSVEVAPGQEVRGVATGCDAQGSLLVLDADGQTQRIISGTVTEIEA